MNEKNLDRIFETNPDTVYGVLLLCLVLAIIWLAVRNVLKDRKLIQLNVSTIEVLKDLNTSLLLMKEQSQNMSADLKEHIDYTREHISEKINNLKI